MAGWKSCELSNVIGTFLALVLSTLGAVSCWIDRDKFEGVLRGMGRGAQSMRWNERAHVFIVAFVLIFNIFATAAVGLSTFDSSHARTAVVHYITSSKAFCVMRVVAALTFLVQLFSSQYFVVTLVISATLSRICLLGRDMQYETQDLLYRMGNWSANGGTFEYDPYGDRPTVSAVADTSGVLNFITNLDVSSFCTHGQEARRVAQLFWLGSFLTVISQALMTVTLNGEKERVYTHELHEEHNYGRAASQTADSLQQAGRSLFSQAGGLGSLAQGLAQSLPQGSGQYSMVNKGGTNYR